MTLVQPVRTGPLATLNPVAKLGAALIVTLALLLSIDPVSAGVALGLELLLLLFAGLSLRTIVTRTAPVWIAAPLAGLTTLLYGQTSGTVYVQWWAVEISGPRSVSGAAVGPSFTWAKSSATPSTNSS